MRVLMYPFLSSFDKEESGIKRVVEAYHKYGSNVGIEFVECGIEDYSLYDVLAVHAGTSNRHTKEKPFVAHLHGLYWTSDYNSELWEWKANRNVVNSATIADKITVPSSWVAETIARDMRVMPYIIHHGIEWQEWEHKKRHMGYVLWNKNRKMDVCNPYPVGVLANRFRNISFVTTFAPDQFSLSNIDQIGIQPHEKMKDYVQRAAVYLSTTKETFGIGILEALASGVPVLGFAFGGNMEMVKHMKNGYLAKPNDYDDLCAGLEYCVNNRRRLSANAISTAKSFTWESSVAKLRSVYDSALREHENNKRPMFI